MITYLRALSLCYFVGFLLHGMDLLDLRLQFSGMSMVWKSWTLFLLVFDFIAAAGLWLKKCWGVLAFIAVASSQLVAYLGFVEIFGEQPVLVWFHVLTLSLYGFFAVKERSLLYCR